MEIPHVRRRIRQLPATPRHRHPQHHVTSYVRRRRENSRIPSRFNELGVTVIRKRLVHCLTQSPAHTHADIKSFLTVMDGYWTRRQAQMRVQTSAKTSEKVVQYQPSVYGWFTDTSSAASSTETSVPCSHWPDRPTSSGRKTLVGLPVWCSGLGKSPGNLTLGESELLSVVEGWQGLIVTPTRKRASPQIPCTLGVIGGIRRETSSEEDNVLFNCLFVHSSDTLVPRIIFVNYFNLGQNSNDEKRLKWKLK